MNLYPEINPQDTEPDAAVTHYPRPGLRPIGVAPPAGPGRGIFTASNGKVFAVVGRTVYYVSPDFTFNQLGTLFVNQQTPVSIADNGTTAVLVDSSNFGYTINLKTNAFAAINDPTGLFVGSTRVDYADTFLAFNTPNTTQWYTSLSNQVAFNALISAAKSSHPDPIQTLVFNLRQMWLIGSDTSEVWYLSGGASFPYASWPNVFIPYGCVAPYSLAQADVDIFWLSRNPQGQSIVVKSEGYGVVAISTRALEFEFQTYLNISDAVAYTYQQAGHTFYVISFPSANKTYAYDLATKQWHQRAWLDANGNLNRERVAFSAEAYGTVVGQDWQTGQIYALDLNTFTDNGQPIACIRSFPHVLQNLKEVTHVSFVADMAAQNPTLLNLADQTVSMRYSNNGGATWSNYRRKPMKPGALNQGGRDFNADFGADFGPIPGRILTVPGQMGAQDYRSLMRWPGLGMARDRIYEVSWAVPALVTLQGAYLDPASHSR